VGDIYILQVPMFAQYRYAWCEPAHNNYSDEVPRCPACGRAVGGRRWQAPYDLEIYQPRRVGDFVNGPGGFDMVVSRRVKECIEASGLKGVSRFDEARIVKMGKQRKDFRYPVPQLFGATIHHSGTRVDWDASKAVWQFSPELDYCRVCGPGGGGNSGIWSECRGLVLETGAVVEADLSFAINLAGTIIATARAAQIILEHEFTNVEVLPADKVYHRRGTWRLRDDAA
jgi:hypothetical protein